MQMYKPDEIDFTPRHKKKGKSKAGKVEKRKQGVRFERTREQVKEHRMQLATQEEQAENEEETKSDRPKSVFDRFKKTEK